MATTTTALNEKDLEVPPKEALEIHTPEKEEVNEEKRSKISKRWWIFFSILCLFSFSALLIFLKRNEIIQTLSTKENTRYYNSGYPNRRRRNRRRKKKLLFGDVEQYQKLYIFGDSTVSEPENGLFSLGIQYPPSPPYSRRWSNGEVFPSLLRDKLVRKGFLRNCNDNYENFALGGSVVNNELTLNLFGFKSLVRIGNGSPEESPESFIFTRPLDCETGVNCPTLDEGFFAATNPIEGSQIDLFSDGNHDEDLIVIVVGGNDLSFIPLTSTQEEILQYITGIITGYIRALGKLYNKGARNFILMTPADASQIPESNNENVDDLNELSEVCLDAILSGASAAFASLLQSSVQSFLENPLFSEAKIKVANFYGCMRENEINDRWEQLGFTDARGTCLPLGDRLPPQTLCDDVDSTLWVDAFHFTEAAHKYFARQLFKLIVKDKGCFTSTVFTPTDFADFCS